MTVTSTSYILSLRQRRARDESGHFFIEGARFVTRAFQSGWELQALIVSRGFPRSPAIRKLLPKARQHGIPIREVSNSEYAVLTNS
ncbi:MAG: RNA methyltransferase substrate-binding domain-containing protein, partial [Myxococcota bacterium]